MKENVAPEQMHFLEEIVAADLAAGKYESILTRFPPEPNGYLHIGHSKSICLNFDLAAKFGGKTNLNQYNLFLSAFFSESEKVSSNSPGKNSSFN